MRKPAGPVVVKKYGNRRLYDTEQSRYVTLDELAARIRGGDELRVVDAKTGEELTQVTLAQIILEDRGAARLLPVPLLVQLIRLGDHALAEFLGQYVSMALASYLQARQGLQALTPYAPFGGLFGSPGLGGPLSGFPGLGGSWPTPFAAPRHPGAEPAPDARPEPAGAASEPETAADAVAALRRELEELKGTLRTAAPRARSRRRRS